MKKYLSRFFIAGLASLLGITLGCSSHGQGRSLSTMQTSVQARGATEQTEVVFPEYRLGFGDVIEIKFHNKPLFNETVTVRPDGRISLERISELQVSGMTPATLDSILTATYGEFLLTPGITVIVRQFGGYQVYVLGEVHAPGGFPIQRNMTVLQALAQAGGPTDGAKLSSVMVLRRGRGKEIDALKIDFKKSVKAQAAARGKMNDIYLQPQDIVYVPKTFIANVSTFMSQIYKGILPPLDLYIKALLFYD